MILEPLKLIDRILEAMISKTEKAANKATRETLQELGLAVGYIKQSSQHFLRTTRDYKTIVADTANPKYIQK